MCLALTQSHRCIKLSFIFMESKNLKINNDPPPLSEISRNKDNEIYDFGEKV